MTIVGTRPELIKLSRVIAELDKRVDHTLVHTGQNFDFELNQVFFEELEIRKPDYFLEAAGENAAQTIANVITKSDELFRKEKPDALLIYGDTNSCMAVISAKRLQIPVFHMEAGNRCFDQRVPEEINRKIVDHLSDINMPLTEHARRYLVAEGIRPETVIKTGSCMREILDHYKEKIELSQTLEDFSVEPREYFLVSCHREENVDYKENLRSLFLSLEALCEEYGFPIIVSMHPRTRKVVEKSDDLDIQRVYKNSLIRFMKPLGFIDYVNLQKHAACVISDSGTIAEESSILGFPAITVRNAHERPEGMDEGAVIMSGLEPAKISESIRAVTQQFKENPEAIRLVEDYRQDNVSKKVVRIILSYIGYVNSFIWKKNESHRTI